MKLNSVASLGFYVNNLDKTCKFYESLGFRPGKRDDKTATFYLNWFSLNFVDQNQEEKSDFLKEAQAEPKGSGIYINIKVDDVDATYKEIIDLGHKPSSEPRDWPWGNREFVLRDPDGYKLVFFQKK